MTNPSPISDQELLHRLRQGDREALRTIFHRYFNYLSTIAFSYVADDHQTKDLIQDVFYELWKKKAKLRITSSLKFYLRKAVINKSINYLKSRRFQFEETGDYAELPSQDVGIQQKLETDDLQAVINKAIDALPHRCRLIFMMSRMEGLTHREIAEKLEISTKTIENQISKALHLLRKAVEPYLKTLAVFGFWEWWG